jgi:allophanate hydrolase subunit 1
MPYRIVPAGESALIVEFEERIDPEVNARAIACADAIQAAGLAGVRDVVPTYRSVAVYFDLTGVAAFAGVPEADVVRIHADRTYRVFMLGFVPGFAYLGIVDERIAMLRHATPRVRVPAGSVGIAGVQTGVYSGETPGGWQLIGRTPVKPFDPSRGDPFLMKAGDTVQFYPIDRGEYERWT